MLVQNKKDWFPFLTVISIVILRVLVWLYMSAVHIYIIIPLISLVFILYTVKHNHLHHNMLSRGWQNHVFEHVMNIFTGTTFSSLKIVHLANHHREENKSNDWGHTKPFERRNQLYGLLIYVFVTPYRFIKGKKHWIRENGNDRIKKRIKEESYVLAGAYILLITINPLNTILFIILPNLLCQFVLIAFNYIQHSGCDPNSPYNHSRNFTGKWLNFFTFNNGYHTVHHLRPHAHWSAYPSFHASIKSKIDPQLNIDNFPIFLLKLIFRTKSIKLPT